MAPEAINKIKDRNTIKAVVEKLKREGKRIGYTSGVFDILHVGHVTYLEKAKLECDVLIVGVNSDSSVRSNKGERRPIIGENERVVLLGALGCVDFVFVFSETNNNKNIETLKPDVYFKASDYEKATLSSAKIVESYGGKVSLLPYVEGQSTSGIINTVISRYHPANAEALKVAPTEFRPAVFLDRDGTINELIEYLHEPTKMKLISGVSKALRGIQDAGYRLVIVTNQPGIGMGYFSKEDFFLVNKELLSQLSQAGVLIDKILYCPHSKADKCSCRKPNTALIDRAKEDLNLDLEKSFVVGDMTGDIQLGKNVGCKTVLVKTGQGGKDSNFDVKPDYVADDLLAASQIILGKKL
jgi:rfaE bifunctional protein nucleotidyltransferase chain/domain